VFGVGTDSSEAVTAFELKHVKALTKPHSESDSSEAVTVFELKHGIAVTEPIWLLGVFSNR
jgi:hypothetical protein